MDPLEETPITDLEGWYTAGEAAKMLSRTSERPSDNPVEPAYVRLLAKLGKVQTMKIGERTTLYKKTDIDAYKVEAPAVKANRVRRAMRIVRKPGVATDDQPAG